MSVMVDLWLILCVGRLGYSGIRCCGVAVIHLLQ